MMSAPEAGLYQRESVQSTELTPMTPMISSPFASADWMQSHQCISGSPLFACEGAIRRSCRHRLSGSRR